MATKAKVNVPREKLIEALQKRVDEWEQNAATNLSDKTKRLVVLLKEFTARVEKGEDITGTREIWELAENVKWERQGRDGYGRTVPKPVTKERLEQQLKVLKLSDDEKVSISVDDEIYELL